MKKERKTVEVIPEEFASCQEAADFWDTHDTTDYPDVFSDTDIDVDLKGKRFEIDIDEDVMENLRLEARRKHVRPGQLANHLLRKDLEAVRSR